MSRFVKHERMGGPKSRSGIIWQDKSCAEEPVKSWRCFFRKCNGKAIRVVMTEEGRKGLCHQHSIAYDSTKTLPRHLDEWNGSVCPR